MIRLCSFLLLLAVAALGAVACDGEGDGTTTPGPTEIVLTPVLTAGPRTPIPTPIITDSLLEDPAKGYAARIPEGWSADPNVLSTAATKADAFFAPEEIRGVQPSISVTREELSASETTEDYLATKRATLQGIGARDLQLVGGVTVAGQEAAVLTYGLTRDSIELAKMDVIFATDGVGWMLSLTVPAGEEATYGELFQVFVDSFRLLSESELTPTPE